MYKLVIQDDEGKTTVVPLIRDELTIGRKEGNTIRLTERNVSRRHAKVYRANGSISIEDLDSYNGIRVNGTRIQGRVELKESDRIQIGDYLIEIKSEAAEKASQEEETQPIERIDPMATTPVPAQQPDAAPTVPTPVLADGSNAPSAPAAGAAAKPAVPLADTDPAAAALATPAPAPQPGPPGNARLVILSTNFAGQEFELDKPAMVVGRTDENDVWINHRSISRHHAKVVRENGRYAIVDLQSSNGVRVNGEEYGKVELRRGDVVDLGHVRLRFVEPGEDFVFGRDAQPVDLAPPKSGRSAMWAILILVLAAAGVGGFLVMRDQGGAAANETEETGEPDGPGGNDTDQAVANTDDLADAAVEEIPPEEDVTEEVRDLNDRAQEAVRNEEWEDAVRLAEAALERDEESSRAAELKQQAEAELEAQVIYQALQDCGSRDLCVIEQFNKLSEDSVYKVKARERYEKAVEAYKVQVKRKARRATRGTNRKRCMRRLQKLAGEMATKELPELAETVRRFEAQCPRPVAANPPNNDRKNGGGNGNGGNNGGNGGDGGGNDGNGGGGGGGGGNPGPSAAALVKQAQAAAKASQFGKALRLCQGALNKQPRNQQATMVCAIASCNLKSKAGARRYIRQLRSSGQKSMARQICLRNGIQVD